MLITFSNKSRVNLKNIDLFEQTVQKQLINFNNNNNELK
jgi:hypothetical protein